MFTHATGYQFVQIPESRLESLQKTLKDRALDLNLCGTIILACEGINFFLAGSEHEIHAYHKFLNEQPDWSFLKVSCITHSKHAPFSHLSIKIKKEIVTMGYPHIQEQHNKAPYLTPSTLKSWYQEGRDFMLLDTRNDYEVALGAFDRTTHLQLSHFRQFPEAVRNVSRTQTVVTVCTGGIRCEKASVYMKANGFESVYQLQGGILNYFQSVGSDYYRGDCFVFDNRFTLNTYGLESNIMRSSVCHKDSETDTYGRNGTHLHKNRCDRHQSVTSC